MNIKMIINNNHGNLISCSMSSKKELELNLVPLTKMYHLQNKCTKFNTYN